MKKYSFFFHYNKPESQKTGSPKLSVHFRGTCYIVDHVHVTDIKNLITRHRKHQPKCVLTGKASKVIFTEKGNLKYLLIFG